MKQEQELGTAKKWPDHSVLAVSRVIGQLEVLRETLPAITDSNLFPFATQNAVLAAVNMLHAYREACEVAEASARQEHEAQLVAIGQETAEKDVQERIRIESERLAKALIADIKAMQRRKPRKGAKKGVGRG